MHTVEESVGVPSIRKRWNNSEEFNTYRNEGSLGYRNQRETPIDKLHEKDSNTPREIK